MMLANRIRRRDDHLRRAVPNDEGLLLEARTETDLICWVHAQATSLPNSDWR